jgi:hypothetical protein
MFSTIRAAIIAATVALLAACGGGGTEPEPAPAAPAAPEQPAPRAFARVVAIGNSMIAHAPAPEIGWTGSWGMAAPTAGQDLAHLTAEGLGVPLHQTFNVVGVEHYPEQAAQFVGQISVPADALVVVKLGENVAGANLEAYRVAFAALLDQARGAALVCVSTYWPNSGIDAVMRPACEARGGRWVNVGDLFDSPDNTDRLTVEYRSAAVDNHPRAWGMRAMAERVIEAVR